MSLVVHLSCNMDVESCPVCWRAFSREVVPACLPCGHSFCMDCGSAIRSCSLCRHRLPPHYVCKVNYALASLIEKLDRNSRTEQISIQTQTDAPPQPASASTTNRRPGPPNLLDGRAVTVLFKRTGLHFSMT